MSSSGKLKVAFIWFISIALTIVLVTLLVVKIVKSKSYDSYEDLVSAKLTVKDITSADNEGVTDNNNYYVFIYSSKDEYDAYKHEELEETICTYANYVREQQSLKKEVVPIYLYDINSFKANADYSSCKNYLTSVYSTLDITEVPILVLVSNSEVSSVYITVGGSNGILSTLENEMNNNAE